MQAAQVCNMVDPQIAAGLRVPVGGWWTTRGGAWAKGEHGRGSAGRLRYRLFHVKAARSMLAAERAYFALWAPRWEAVIARGRAMGLV